MAVAELPLPPFPYEKDFFGSPFPKGGKKALCRFSERNRIRRNQMDEQEKELEEILRMFDKAPSPSSERNNQAQMRQNNLQSRQISQKPIDAERTARTSNHTAYKRQPQSSKGRYLSPKRKAAIKRRKRQRAVVVSLSRLNLTPIYTIGTPNRTQSHNFLEPTMFHYIVGSFFALFILLSRKINRAIYFFKKGG